MPKRRAAQNVEDSGSEDTSPPRRRRLNDVVGNDDESDMGSPPPQSATQSHLQAMIAKLVRLALSAEYARIPVRRTDISAKVLGESGARQFKAVFEGAQRELQSKFGMQMIELPSREKDKMGMAQRRAATQASQKSQSASSKSWSLISILPEAYKTSTTIVQPASAPSQHTESTYTALYTFIISVILLSASDSIPEAKLERYLKKANADSWTPIGQTEKLLQRMTKEGYLVKTRDTSSGEEVIEYSVGPRGKTEVGAEGVKGLVRKVYEGAGVEEDDLGRRLDRSLGITAQESQAANMVAGAGDEHQEQSQTQTRTRQRARAMRGGDSDEDD